MGGRHHRNYDGGGLTALLGDGSDLVAVLGDGGDLTDVLGVGGGLTAAVLPLAKNAIPPN